MPPASPPIIHQDIFLPLATLLGLILGSFGTACVHRWLNELSLVKPLRSMCPKCETQLEWWQNIPLLSYVLLRGKCHFCKERISWRYPALELLCGLWAYAVADQYGFSIAFGLLLVLGVMLLIASFIDLESFLLPDIITLPGALIALVAATFFLGDGPWIEDGKSALLGAAIGGGGFFLLRMVYKILRGIEGLGLGDVKLMLLIGALVGPTGLPLTIILAGITAILGSIFWLVGSKDGARTHIPFGPFLSLAAMIYVLWGETLWTVWMGIPNH